MQIINHTNDLSIESVTSKVMAIDTETMGLVTHRDRLCVVQISFGDGISHLVKYDGKSYDSPILKKLLEDDNIVKIFHYARFDVAALKYYLKAETRNIFCTKIASKLVRTYTDKHGLKTIVAELLGKEMFKYQQSSDWGKEALTKHQQEYAAYDVVYLHNLMDILSDMLKREGRFDIAQKCFNFIPTRVDLDLLGWSESDIFAHM